MRSTVHGSGDARPTNLTESPALRVKLQRIIIALGVAVTVPLLGWRLRGVVSEERRVSALLSYRNGLVVAEIARVEALLRRAPPRTIAGATTIVGSAPTICNDKNEPGPLDDPRTERCPRGAACHEAFYMTDWYVRRHIEPPDTRVWFDRKLDTDDTSGRLRIRAAGCKPGDLVLAIDELDPARFSLGDW
jgi:hypothetical protein